jgi:hypothetical protein
LFISSIKTGSNTHTNHFQGKSVFELTVYLSRATNTVFVLAGRGNQFNLKDVIITFNDVDVNKISGLNINKLDTYSIMLESLEVSYHEIRALEKLGALNQMIGQNKQLQITEQFTIFPSKHVSALDEELENDDHLAVYSIEGVEGSISGNYSNGSLCSVNVTYSCAPEVKGLSVEFCPELVYSQDAARYGSETINLPYACRS